MVGFSCHRAAEAAGVTHRALRRALTNIHALLGRDEEVLVTLDTLTSALNQGGQHLGDLVWWTLAEARITRSTLETIWNDAHLAPEFLPDPPTAEKALKAAVRETAVGHADRLIRLGKDDESEIVFAVVRETKHADGSVTYKQETRIILDRTAETVYSDNPGHDLAAVVAARFGELRTTHTPDDIRRSMMKVLNSCMAVTLREHGGVYWIPALYADGIRRLRAGIEKIGVSKLYLVPVHQGPDATRSLGDAARTAIEDELAALKVEVEVEGFLGQPPERISTLVRRLDAFETLRMRANLYRDVLQVHVQDLEKTLGDLTTSVETLLNQKAAA